MNILKARLTLFLLNHHLSALVKGKLTVARLVRSLRKQMIVSSLFRDAKYSKVGGKIFIDPFAPYFPSPYCGKLFDNNTAESYPAKPNFAQISITNRCPCQCVHCHVVNTRDADLPKELILETIGQISQADFPLLFFVGGEPMARFDDLLEFVALAQKSMDTRIFTSGVGASPERLMALRKAGLEGICVSLDHHREAEHNGKRNHPTAFKDACNTIREASSLGFYVSVVCCTTSSMVRSGDTFKVVDLAESLGAHSIQLNEIRPVGKALETEGYDLFLTPDDKKTLIGFYREANRSSRRIAIVMPWYNEEPDKFGCTATSAQQAYIDARGNVQPCPLLKVGLGNIREQSFRGIWENFRSRCGHPVRECIVHRLAGELAASSVLPLPVQRTYQVWPEICRIEPTDVFKRLRDFGATAKGEPMTSRYNLGLRAGVDFEVKREHWLPEKLGIGCIAFGKTLYLRGPEDPVPQHEFLHIAQFHKFGTVRVVIHYLVHLTKNYRRFGNFKESFREVPFEKEARAFEAGSFRNEH